MSMKYLWRIQGDALIDFEVGVDLGMACKIRLPSYDLVRGINERQIRDKRPYKQNWSLYGKY
jgi:hypothetical protein